MLKIVIDTNVLVSALLKDRSLPAFILALIRRRQVVLCLSKEIFAEYEGVLNRDKFGLIRKEVGQLLANLKKEALWFVPKERIDMILQDPEDNKFLECAYEAEADFLITGNTKHFPFKKFRGIEVVSPREFIEGTLKAIITTG